MNYRLANFALLFLFGAGVFSPTSSFAQFKDLSRRIPDGANMLVLVDVDQLFKSSLGKKEGWREKHENAFEGGVSAIPPQASKYVAAAKLDLATMDPEWKISIMNLSYEPSIPKVAQRYQGTIDKIRGKDVAVLPGDTYVVKLTPKVAVVGSPASRQDVSRWLSRLYSSTNRLRGLSPYLAEAEKFAENTSPFIMAMDLTDIVPAAMVRQGLETSEALKGKDVDLDKISEALASIRGVTLGITVSQGRYGAIKVDFNEDITVIKDFAKPLLLEVLGNHGVMIDEFEDWDVTVSEKQIQIQGTLFQSGTRRILSLLDAPPSLQEAVQKSSSANPESQERLTVLASQMYYKSVSSLIDDLKGSKKKRKSMGQIGVWFGKYATKIDRLSMVNVDPELLDYSRFVSDSLRQGQGEVQSAAARSRVRQNEVPEQYDVSTYSTPIGVTWAGAYSWNGWSSTSNQRRTGQMRSNVRTQERLRGNMSANLILQHIDGASADIRRKMTEKYSADF